MDLGIFLPVSIISSPSEGYNKRSYNCASVITSLSTSPKTSSKISKSGSRAKIPERASFCVCPKERLFVFFYAFSKSSTCFKQV